VTTRFDPTSDPADVERLRRDVARLEHELSVQRETHRIELARLRASTRYRIGSAAVALRTLDGWRRLPGELRSIWTATRSDRRDSVSAIQRDVEPRSAIAVDSILDEFSQRSLEHELTLRPVGRARPRRRTGAEMLLAESAWVGNGGRWRHQFSHFERGNDLDELVGRYRELGVPTVFWNKEDPAHFDTFLPVARRFDHVFTTDADCVERYRAVLGHDRVRTMAFAAQPALQNPIGRDVDPRSICFAGAWRGDVHPQRVEQLTTLLDAALAAGDLRIFARRPANGRADFPERYAGSIVGEIPYDEMVGEYRRHACFLNVNTVTASPTMLSRRVFEILACRTPVVSAPSPAIERLFDGVVPMPSGLTATTSVLSELLENPIRRDRLGQLGFRTVMSSHTYQHRVADLCHALDIDGFPPPALPVVDAVVEVSSEDEIPRALATIEPLRPTVCDVVVICRDGDAASPPHVETRGDAHLVRTGSSRRTDEVLARIPGSGEFVAFLDVDSRYGPCFVTDAMLATRFADADVYGKSSSHAGDASGVRAIGDGREFCQTDDVIAGTAIVRRNTLSEPSLRAVREHPIARAAVEAAPRRFAIDRFNHVAGPDGDRADGTSVHPLSDVVF
jgi:hypothetical protein